MTSAGERLQGLEQGPELVRGIRRWDLLALMINGTIGAGIFGLPSIVFALAGPYSLIAFAGCAVLIAVVMLCFAEVSSRFEQTGGPYLYARTAFGAMVGFEVGWLTLLARLTSFAALCNLFITYLHNLWPAADSAVWRPVLILAIVAGYAAINVRGVRNAAIVSNALTVAKLVPLVVLIVVGVFLVVPARLELAGAPGMGPFSKAMLLLIFAYSGFEAVVIATGEMREPGRNLPWAMLTAIAIVALIYVLVQVVCIGTVPELAHSERPLADAGRRILGAPGQTLATLGALISIAGTLGGIMLVTPRLIFAMAEHGQLPGIVAATHPRFRTPYVSILLCAAAVLALTLAGSFVRALTISAVIRVLTFMATCAALPVLRRRGGPAAFRAPLGVALSVFALVMCVWLLTSIGWHEAREAAFAAALGLPIYLLGRKRTRPSGR